MALINAFDDGRRIGQSRLVGCSAVGRAWCFGVGDLFAKIRRQCRRL